MTPSLDLARKLITEQFPEYAHLPITEVEKQGNDNRTYRLGEELLIRMPLATCYAKKVAIEQELLPKLAKHLSLEIPLPVKMGRPSKDYPYPFSIYKWLAGQSLNCLTLTDQEKEQLAYDLAKFLKELQSIKDVPVLVPGQHNFWRGAHVSVYDKGFRDQIEKLTECHPELISGSRNKFGMIQEFYDQALALWEKACATQWQGAPVWIHGDFAIGNMIMESKRLSAIIDFGGAAMGDPACDLVIAWTYFSGKARQIFIREVDLDDDTWLRARAWALWKATFELCSFENVSDPAVERQKKIIDDVLRIGLTAQNLL